MRSNRRTAREIAQMRSLTNVTGAYAIVLKELARARNAGRPPEAWTTDYLKAAAAVVDHAGLTDTPFEEHLAEAERRIPKGK